MRTTLTLDNDVAAKLQELAHQKRVSFKQIVNETLKAGLVARAKPRPPQKPFRVRASHCGFRPGVDIGKLNRVVDELEAEDFQKESKKRA